MELDGWLDQRGAWDDMLRGLDESRSTPPELLWPSAHARPVLIGALRDAVAELRHVPTSSDLTSLAKALDTARACLATWDAFQAIDNGGLQDVNL